MLSKVRHFGEQFVNGWYDVSRSVWYSGTMSALRTFFTSAFFNRPSMQGTTVTFDLARALYRNDDARYNLGSGFVKPVIDLSAEYIGIPYVTSNSGADDEFLNECIEDFWAPTLMQAWRDALRDSKTFIRFRQPRLDNPLFTEGDRNHGRIDVIAPEQCDLQYDPTDPDLVSVANVTHFVSFDERTAEEILQGRPARIREHTVIESITPVSYRFYDKALGQELTTWAAVNTLGFVPIWPVYNEYAADLGGGQSDIEPILPFIEAFHEVLLQTLTAHKYHSSPKAKLKVKDITNFLKNNFPAVLDSNNKVIAGATVSWTGRELFILEADEDIDFITIKSVLGDSKALLEFLIDCICIASETPKWALLKDQGASDHDASVQPFEKKIARKRTSFSEIVVMLCKMVSVANGRMPNTVTVAWHTLRLADLAAKSQAFQQLVLGLDVASQHEWLSDETSIAIIGTLFSEVNSPAVEKARAKTNVVPLVSAPAPASPTQALPPGSKNGSGATSTAKAALTTTTPSKS